MVRNIRAEGPLVIFDLCNTLYAANTTVGFLEHYRQMSGRPHIARALRRWTERRSPFFYIGALAYRLFDWDIARTRLISALAGEPRQSLTEAVQSYVSQVLPPLRNQPLHDRLARHKAAGDRIMIVSNSLDLVVAPIAEALEVDFVASTLGFDGAICNGRIECDLTGRKAYAVRHHAGSNESIARVYTDNRSDLDIVTIAEQASIVIPRGRRDEQWGGPRCEYIRL